MLRTLIFFASILSLATCTDDLDDGRFPCGPHGGSCDLASELCVVGPEGCSTCVPLPEACDPDTTCGCLPAGNDESLGDNRCEDAGVCSVDGGLVLTCSEIAWGCG